MDRKLTIIFEILMTMAEKVLSEEEKQDLLTRLFDINQMYEPPEEPPSAN